MGRATRLRDCRLGGNDDIRPGALYDGFQFGLLFDGNRELIQRLLKVVEERLPLLAGNLQVGMRVRHRLAGVFLRAACSPADHLRHQVLESRRRYAMVRFVTDWSSISGLTSLGQ